MPVLLRQSALADGGSRFELGQGRLSSGNRVVQKPDVGYSLSKLTRVLKQAQV
jgi:hypothetical protein